MSEALKSKTCTCGRDQMATLHCGLCAGDICRSCAEFLPADSFAFMKKPPKEFVHPHYCLSCYSVHVQPVLESYALTMERAKGVFIIDKPRRKPLPLLRCSVETLSVEDCPDRNEAVLRIAFFAAELGFNSVIRANIAYKKVRNAGYQKMVWQATGIPADLDGRKLDRQSE